MRDRLDSAFFSLVLCSVVALLVSLGPELQLARRDRTNRAAWIPSVVLQSLAGVGLGVVAHTQKARGLPLRGQTAFGVFLVAIATWLFLSALLGQFDRTRVEARQVFRACLALTLGFVIGMLLPVGDIKAG